MQGRDPVHSCSASKGKRLKPQFSPTEYSWAEIRKVNSKGISWPQTGTAGRLEGRQSGEFGTMSALRTLGWELVGQDMST